jgi:Membrane protein involved in the export of O-antigen and teichoic acid
MNKYKKLLSDTGLFAISNFASKLITFLLLPLYTSKLTTNEYGISDFIFNTINLLFPILTLAITEATLRFAFEKNVKKNEVLAISLFLILLNALILISISPFISKINETISNYWAFFILMYIGIVLNTCFSNYLRGCNKIKQFAIQGIFQTIIIVVLNIIFLLVFNMGLNGYLIATIGGFYFSLIFIIIYGDIWKELRHFKLNLNLIKEMLKYSIPMIPALIAWWMIMAVDRYIIIANLGLADSGLYSVAYKIPSILTAFTLIFTQAWQVSAIPNFGERDNADFFSKTYRYFNVISILICSILILLAEFLGKILFANNYFIAWTFVPFLLIAFVFSGLSGFLATIFVSAKKTNILFVSTCIGALIDLFLNIFFIKFFGLMGAAFITMLSFMIMWLIRLKMSHKFIKIETNLLKDWLGYLFLLFQAFIMSQQTVLYYLWSIIIVVIIFLLNIKDIFNLLTKTIYEIKNVVKNGKY